MNIYSFIYFFLFLFISYYYNEKGLSALSFRAYSSSASGAALVIAEHDGKSVNGATLKAITAASQLGNSVVVLAAGSSVKDVNIYINSYLFYYID